MRSRTKGLSAATVATVFAFAGAGGAALAVPESGGAGSSSANITLEDCVLESSKEISYVEYLADGTAVDKDETLEGESLDLSTVEGIDDVDEVEVKAGTTVETFAVDCVAEDGTAGGAGEEDAGDGDGAEKMFGNGRANANSTATITMSDCLLESSKEISYVEYLADGTAVDKDESVDAETFDLTTVEGIADVDEVEVKAGTTVEAFDVACADGEQTPEDGTVGGTGDETETDEEADAAVITLSGCTVESTKDISYIEFFSGDTSWKDESMNSENFDLTTVEGIEDVDSITVKSSTTVEEFGVTCGTQDDAETGDGAAASGSGETEHTEGADNTEESEEPETDGRVANHGTEDAESEEHSEETEASDSEEETEDAEDSRAGDAAVEHDSEDAEVEDESDDTDDDEEESDEKDEKKADDDDEDDSEEPEDD